MYDKYTGKLIGFTDLGDINSHLLSLEQSLVDSKLKPLATTIMTFIVRGLFSHLQFPYARFPCHKVAGDLLYDPFWEAVYRLERCGFKVCSWLIYRLHHAQSSVCMYIYIGYGSYF